MRLVFIVSILISGLAAGQNAVDITSEPHHTLLLENGKVRVFELALKPGDRAFVRHEHNFLVVTLQDCELVVWPEGKSDIMNFRFGQGDVRFSFGGQAVGFRNDRTAASRQILVEFLDPKVTSYGYQAPEGGWDYGAMSIAPPTDPRAAFSNSLFLAAATARDIQLLPGDLLAPPEKEAAELLIPVTDMDLKASETQRIRKSPGEVVWIPMGRKAKLRNAGDEPARFVVIEFPPPPAEQ